MNEIEINKEYHYDIGDFLTKVKVLTISEPQGLFNTVHVGYIATENIYGQDISDGAIRESEKYNKFINKIRKIHE